MRSQDRSEDAVPGRPATGPAKAGAPTGGAGGRPTRPPAVPGTPARRETPPAAPEEPAGSGMSGARAGGPAAGPGGGIRGAGAGAVDGEPAAPAAVPLAPAAVHARLDAASARLEAARARLHAVPVRLDAVPVRLDAVPVRLEALPSRGDDALPPTGGLRRRAVRGGEVAELRPRGGGAVPEVSPLRAVAPMGDVTPIKIAVSARLDTVPTGPGAVRRRSGAPAGDGPGVSPAVSPAASPRDLPGDLPVALPDPVREAVLAPLVDHHCRGVERDDIPRARFETLISDSGTPAPPGTTHFDTPLGTAIRRWCAPLLDLDPHASPAVYVSRRAELGADEANRRLLRAAGAAAFLVDTGEARPELLTAAEMGRLGGAAADEITSVEQVEQRIAESARTAVDYMAALAAALHERAARAVGLASSIAHRHGLHFDPARPSRGSVIAAANRRLADPREPLADPVLLRHLLWAAVDVSRERGLPLQMPTGYGRAAFDPHRSDPTLMTGFLRIVQQLGVPIILLHCYPFHRQAAHLACVFPHVYLDVGLALTGTASSSVIGELLDLVPFHKQMFGSGGSGVAEIGFLGALHHRRALARALATRLERGEWAAADAARVAHMIGAGNARRVYRL
ncbi:hypothetical protein SAMN05421505_10789 [Sinosporangium album]|uniref:Amidohydrolase-related domain-containing protein n=1 Tax=Sinosporangium album TaxID=504805 RepID=A0A1G7WL67_9ACTN|nr:hypothetical protein [Sinosporangium album]SDG72751.1 hypothetical protein SAMN05421505_10789 [Sinosporangium album]